MDVFSFLFACFAFFNYMAISTAFSCDSVINLQAESYYTNTLTSPNYPSYYPSASCKRWKISAPSGKQVQLKFTYFDTYGYPTCTKSTDDTLKIYDSISSYTSSMIGRYCGNYLPANVVSRTGNLFLVFNSNSRFLPSKKGFKLGYVAVSAKKDYSICSPFNAEYNNKNIRLDATGSYKYIKSPLYPNKYPSDMNCVWYITASSSSKRIKLKFTDVQISNYFNSYSCSSSGDALIVYDGNTVYDSKIKEVCGRAYSTITSSGRYMTVVFKSNLDNYVNSYNKAMFKVEFIEVDQSTNATGVVVGAIFAVILAIGFIVCCACIARRRRTAGYVQCAPAVTATIQSTTTTTAAPQYPMQGQGPPQGFYPPPSSSYPPPAPGSYPLGSQQPPGSSYPPPVQGSYPPPVQGSYPPPVQDSYPPAATYPPPNDPPPQYPGPPAYPPVSPYNPQVAPQPNPPYPSQPVVSGDQQATYPPPVDNKANAPPPF